MEHIASRENERVKFACKLASSAAFRAQQGLFFAEGKRLCFDLASSTKPHTAFFTQKFLRANPQAAQLAQENYLISQPVDDKLAGTKTPQGLYCLFSLPACRLQDVKLQNGVLVCETVQNPENVGAVLRSAAAFGFGGVVLLAGCADAFAPKALRAGMGASLRLPVVAGANLAETIAFLRGAGAAVYAAALQGAAPLGSQSIQKPFALLVGNEGAGLSAEALALADKRVCIPMQNGAESLNAAVAASVLMFHFSGLSGQV